MKEYLGEDYKLIYHEVKEAVIFLNKTFFPAINLPSDTDEAMKVFNDKWKYCGHAMILLILAELTKKIAEISETK